MAKTIPKHVAIREDFHGEVRGAFLYAQRLENIIGLKSKGSSEVFHGKVDHSQPPWNASAASLIMELHAWVRFTERLWRRSIGFPERVRGGSHVNTWKGLAALTALAEAVDDMLVCEDRRWLTGWCRRASITLGETESLKRLPRLPGEAERKCPWCKKSSLREMPLDGVIFCIDVKCRDDEDRRPRAQLEYFRGDMVLRWQDGVIGAP